MTKELEFIRKAVIKACHPDCKSYEDALEKELYNGCNLIKESGLEYKLISIRNGDNKYLVKHKSNCLIIPLDRKDFEIIGQTITLARVLIALNITSDIYFIDNAGYIYEDIVIGIINIKTLKEEGGFADAKLKYICKWDLTKNLDQQEPETISSIAKLLGYEKQK